MDDLAITVAIADRTYKVRVPRDEEEIFRQAVKVVDEKSQEYSKLYAYKDKQDLIAMVLLQYVTAYLRLEDRVTSKDVGLIEKLADLDKLLTNSIREN